MRDNVWANCTNYFYSSGILQLVATDNGYCKTATNVFPDGHPLVISNLVFDSGPLSLWYCDSNSAVTLINAGSRTAAAAGLTNFTLFTNVNYALAEIGDSGTVDVGAHLYTVDSNGYPVGCQSITNTNTCVSDPFVTFAVSSPIFSLTNGTATNTCTATTMLNNGFAEGIVIGCDGSMDETTNIPIGGTIVSNWVVVYWSSNTYTFKGTLTWKLTNTYGGFGTNVFYTKLSSSGPCAGTFTNSYSNTFTVANWIATLTNSNDGLGSGDDFGPGIDSSPALSPDGSTVYIENTGDLLYALNVNTGAILQVKQITTRFGEITSSPAVGSDGTVFAGTTDGYLDSFSSSLTLNWSKLLGTVSDDVGVYATPALTPDGTVYIGTDEGEGQGAADYDSGFWSFTTNGSKNWFYLPWQVPDDEGDVESSAAVGSDGTVYFQDEDNLLYALSPDGIPSRLLNNGDFFEHLFDRGV